MITIREKGEAGCHNYRPFPQKRTSPVCIPSTRIQLSILLPLHRLEDGADEFDASVLVTLIVVTGLVKLQRLNTTNPSFSTKL